MEATNYPALIELLSRGADPNAADKHKLTPLHYAIFKGYLHIAATLLQGKADPNAVDDQTVSFIFTDHHFALLFAGETCAQ